MVSGALQITILSGDFRAAFEQPSFLLTVFFLRLTACSFAAASVKTRNFLTLKKNSGERVHGWSALHDFHSLQHNSRIKKLHTERWILNNYVDLVYRDMPSLAAEVLMLCFMWLLHSVKEASWTPQQASAVFQGLFQYPSSPLPWEVLRQNGENRRLLRTAKKINVL